MARLLALSAVLLAASAAAPRPAGGPSSALPSHAQITTGADIVAAPAGAPAVHALAAAFTDDLPAPRACLVASHVPPVLPAAPLAVLALAPKTSPPASPRHS